MKLTRKTEYAFLALITLSQNYEIRLVKTKDLVSKNIIPKKFLDQILLELKSSGYILSKRGADGGYVLAKNPENITIAEIIRLFDGPLAPVQSVSQYFFQETPIMKNKKLLSLFQDIRNFISHKLEQTTLAMMI